MKNDTIVLTPDEAAELASLDDKAARRRKKADEKSALASAAWTETKALWETLQASEDDAKRLRIRPAYFRARQAYDLAAQARDRAKRAAEKAENHRVVRTYVDDWTAIENPNFFYRRMAVKRATAARNLNENGHA